MLRLLRLGKLHSSSSRYAFADRRFRAGATVEGVEIVGTREAAQAMMEKLQSLPREQPVVWRATLTDIDRSRFTAFDRGRLVSVTGVAASGASASGAAGADHVEQEQEQQSTWFVDCWKEAASETLETMRPYWEDAGRWKVVHDVDEAAHLFARHGIQLRGLLAATRPLSRLVDSSLGSWEGKETKALLQRSSLSDTAASDEDADGNGVGYELEELGRYYGLVETGGEGKKFAGLPEDGAAAHCDQRYFAQWVRENARLARLTEKLYRFLRGRLEQTEWRSEILEEGERLSLWEYAESVVRPLSEMLVEIERQGFSVDRKLLEQMRQEHADTLETHMREFVRIGKKLKDEGTGKILNPGAEFINPRSTAMMRQLLFGGSGKKFPPTQAFPTELQSWINIRGLGLQPLGDRKTKFFTKAGQAKVSADVLVAFAGKNPLQGDYGEALRQRQTANAAGSGSDSGQGEEVSAMLHHAERVNKTAATLSGIMEPIIERLSGNDGKLHASLSLDTSTGRLVSRKPNLQNPPGNDFRRVFTAGEGNALVVADYSQLELRILAHVSKCASMIGNLCSGADYHSATAVEMFPEIAKEIANKNMTIHEVKHKFPTQRAQAKVINFSIVYGKSVRSLAEDLKITEKAAGELLEAWYASKPEVRRWKAEIVQQVHANNFSYSILGRPRYFPHIENMRLKNRSERAAINHCIQGSAADLAVSAMLRVRESVRLRDLGFAMVLQVHDEFILEGPDTHAQEALEIVKDLMQNPFADINPNFVFRVPMLVDAGVGKTWAEAKP